MKLLEVLEGEQRRSYERALKGGHTPASCPTPAGRFRQRIVIEPSGCWRWTGALKAEGYGTLSLRNKPVYAHRFSYESFVGPIPDGLVIDHLCRNRACVNPAHLEPVTMRENCYVRADIPYHRDECRRGHKLIGENVYLRPGGTRLCRACVRLSRQRAAA